MLKLEMIRIGMALIGCIAFQSISVNSVLAKESKQLINNPSEMRVINVADLGIVPNTDVTLEVYTLLQRVKNEKNITLFFPKGQYDFYPDNALEQYRTVANHDNGLKHIGFPLLEHNNLTIDGDGSLFMFHGRIVPFAIDYSSNITLKNFSIDFIRPFHAELHVVKSDPELKSFEVKVDSEQHPYIVKSGNLQFERFGQIDEIGNNILFDLATRSPIWDTRKYWLDAKTTEVSEISQNRLKFSKVRSKVPPINTVLVVYGNHPTSRFIPGIHVTNSKNLAIEDITVHTAGGMGLIVERTENIYVNRYNVTPSGKRHISTRADATHFIGCKGDIIIENSVMKHMLDDAVNVHGAYVNIDKQLAENEFLASISHFQQWGFTFGEPGDKVALLSRETILPFYETTIKSIKPLNEKRFIITLEEVPKDLLEGPLSIENLTWNPNVVIRNNKVIENRARSILITTKGKVLIENNVFNSQMHGILIEGDNNHWYESGAVVDVMIRNNVFKNIGFSGANDYPLYISPLLTKDQYFGEGYYHKNIHFVDNTLESFNGHMVFAQSVEGLFISNNTIKKSTDYPNSSSSPSINLNYSNNVKVENNMAKQFDSPLIIQKAKDVGALILDKNSSFSLNRK